MSDNHHGTKSRIRDTKETNEDVHTLEVHYRTELPESSETNRDSWTSSMLTALCGNVVKRTLGHNLKVHRIWTKCLEVPAKGLEPTLFQLPAR